MATKPQAAALPKEAEKAKYRLTEKAYIDDILYDPEKMPFDPESTDGSRKPLIISYKGIPGPHMEPVNDEARFMKEKYAQFQQAVDPIAELTVIGGPSS